MWCKSSSIRSQSFHASLAEEYVDDSWYDEICSFKIYGESLAEQTSKPKHAQSCPNNMQCAYNRILRYQ